jgi:hypothetical protein
MGRKNLRKNKNAGHLYQLEMCYENWKCEENIRERIKTQGIFTS